MAAGRLIIAMLTLALPSLGYGGGDQKELWTINMYFENDLFSETDQNYTNGLRFSWVSPDLQDYIHDPQLPDWVRAANKRLTFFHKSEIGLQRNIVVSLGQTIYTPEDIDRIDVIEDDRPYAGWLFASLSYQSKSRTQLDTLEAQFGVVGPAALGQQVQDFIHDLRGFEKFAGWDNQLRNEPGILFVWEHKRKLKNASEQGDSLTYDFISHTGLALGNIAGYLNFGAELRVGWIIPNDFGTSAVRPGGDNSAPDTTWDPRITSQRGIGLHCFASFDVRLVAHDIFLDGNTFKDSHSVDKEYVVADASVGVSFVYLGVKMSYAQVFRTREFKQQDHSHSYGSLSISYTF